MEAQHAATGVSQEIHSVTLWILKEVHAIIAEARMHGLHGSAPLESQSIMPTDTSDGQ